jgi:hypothetical protein
LLLLKWVATDKSFLVLMENRWMLIRLWRSIVSAMYCLYYDRHHNWWDGCNYWFCRRSFLRSYNCNSPCLSYIYIIDFWGLSFLTVNIFNSMCVKFHSLLYCHLSRWF